LEAFIKCIESADWAPIFCFSSVSDSLNYFYEQFYRAMSVIPVSFVKIKNSTKPWITPVVLDLINKRWCAYRQKNFPLYVHYKEKVKKEIFKSKKLWSNKMCKSSKGLWSVVNDIRGQKVSNNATQIVSLFSDVHDAVNSINVFFSTFFAESDFFQMLPTNQENVEICNDSTVSALLSVSKTNKAIGSDNIPALLLKLSASYVSRPLCAIFNQSFRSASVPSCLKIADVCPIPKSSPVKRNELRPISLLPVIGKYCENLIVKKFYPSLIQHIDSSQFAYKKKSSTVHALITLHDRILSSLDDTDVIGVRVIAFDLSHAFDCIPHHILLQRIAALDFPQKNYFVNWLNAYLSNRQQRVRLGEMRSCLTNVTSGVPQGSILGPLLFSIFMSTFCAKDLNVSVIKYADDVSIVVPVLKDAPDDLVLFNQEIDNFKLWCQENRMIINVRKTKVMNVCFRADPLSCVPDFDNVTSLKILGIIMNNKLNWSDHFDYVSSKVSRRLYILRVLKSLLSHDDLVHVFNHCIRSLIEYASPVFLNPGSVLDNKLLKLCKRAFRVIHGVDTLSCKYCSMFDLRHRREKSALSIFLSALHDPNHVIHPLLPKLSKRSSRVILPTINTTRRANGFIFSTCLIYNRICNL
jgi:hypothetical protein